MTAVEMLDDDTFLGAENSHNLIVVRKNGDAATDEERQRLDIVGEFHLGEFVNRFRRGSLVMRLPDSDLAKVPTMLFGTINGVIGVVASLPADQYAFLARLQEALCSTVRGVGGLSWAAWRNFGNELRNADVRNFIDGDLIECVRSCSRDCAACASVRARNAHAPTHKPSRANHRSFLDLKRPHMEEVAARVEQSVEELTKRVEDLMRLH
jgi:DNA damage-binding protein 1